MPLAGLLAIHSVTVLNPTVSVGQSMGVNRSFAAGAVISCRVTPLSSTEVYQLMARGMTVSHRLDFISNPNLNEKNRVQWTGVGNGTVMRLVGLPTNNNGYSRFWTMYAMAKTEDNNAPRPVGGMA